MKNLKSNKGFTLIEILIVIGIIAILAAIVIVAINPAKQFAQARNTQRESAVNTVLNAIGQRIADNKGKCDGAFTVGGVTYTCPTLGATKNIGTDVVVNIDLSCLVPTYIPTAVPLDPSGGTAADTLYTVAQDGVGRVTACAPKHAEAAIPDSATFCVTR